MTTRYRLDPGRSQFTVQAFATGLLSFLGHSPTFAVRDFSGVVEFVDGVIGGMRLGITVNASSLELMDNVSSSDRRDIEERMKREVLETSSNPEIKLLAATLSVENISAGAYRLRVDGSLALHGVSRPLQMDVELRIFSDGIRLRGAFPLRLSDYHIKPITALGGAIKLQDEVKLAFDVAGFPEPT
jgi:polyisoprenoid-binding protein YceI